MGRLGHVVQLALPFGVNMMLNLSNINFLTDKTVEKESHYFVKLLVFKRDKKLENRSVKRNLICQNKF